MKLCICRAMIHSEIFKCDIIEGDAVIEAKKAVQKAEKKLISTKAEKSTSSNEE